MGGGGGGVATKHHKNHISIKPGKFAFIQNLQGDHKTIFLP